MIKQKNISLTGNSVLDQNFNNSQKMKNEKYVWTLSDELAAFAKSELGEEPEVS